jgi:RNA polymerase sigma factor, sigma-70 family
VFPGGRKRVGFPESSVRQFEERNPDRLRREAAFCRITEEETEKILHDARRLARKGGCPGDVARRVALATGRSEEAVRYTIRNHDLENEEDAIFPDHHRKDDDVRPETKQQIHDLWRRGRTPGQIQKLFRCFSRARLLRIITDVRLQRIDELPLDCFGVETFEKVRGGTKAEAEILYPIKQDRMCRKVKVPAGLPPYLASLYEIPLLSREQEYQLFRKMSYLRYRARQLRDRLNRITPRPSQMDEIERFSDEAGVVRNQIIQANLRLVVAIAKRHLASMDDFFGLVSDGNMSLMRAVDKFDFTRGNKFSTYASWAIMKNFARTIPEELRRRDRSSAGELEFWEFVDPSQSDPADADFGEPEFGVSLESLLDQLDERERQIIMARYGLGETDMPMTLTQVGEMLGVTKERVRQIEMRAMNRLRRAALRSQETNSIGMAESGTDGGTGRMDRSDVVATGNPDARFSFFGFHDEGGDDNDDGDDDGGNRGMEYRS